MSTPRPASQKESRHLFHHCPAGSEGWGVNLKVHEPPKQSRKRPDSK